ncbi:MAG: hypothetical protein ACMXYG_01935 [Candidatus Woesearchaeota archaeon]
MDIESIIGIADLVLVVLILFLTWKFIRRGHGRHAEKNRIKYERRMEEERENIMKEEAKLIETIPKIEYVEKQEQKISYEIMHKISELEHKIKLEKIKIVPFIEKLLRRERREHIEKTGVGIPQSGEIEKICLEENELIDQIWKLLLKPENISERILEFVTKEDRLLHRDIHSFDSFERELKAEGGLSKTQKKAAKYQDREIREEELELEKIMTIEKKILHELQETRMRCREISHLNLNIIKFAKSHSDKTAVEQDIVKKIAKKLHRKTKILDEIVLSVKVLISYEEMAYNETEKAFKDAKKVQA